MIQFACPKCKTVLQAADNQAGVTIACPKCKTQMKLPSPAPNQPNPPRSVPHPPPVPPAPVPSAPISKVSEPIPQKDSQGDTSGPPPIPQGAGPSNPWWKNALNEVKEIGTATWGQTVRLVNYGRGHWRKRSLDRATLDAQRALGIRMCGAGIGDPQLRSQIAAVDEKVRQAEAKKESTRALKAEREKLVLQLAGPALTQPGPVPGAEAEHTKAKETQAAQRHHADALSGARTGLPPQGRTAWRRVLIGFGTVGSAGLLGLCLLCGGMGSFFGFRGKSGGSGSNVTTPDFSKVDYSVPQVDYSKGPQGQALETRKDTIDGDPTEGTGFLDEKKEFMQHGKTTAFFADGSKKDESWYFNGKQHGDYKQWHKNGQLSYQGTMKNGERHGKFLAWYEDGKPEEEIYYLDGKQHGPAKKWHANGQKSVECDWANGIPIGRYMVWDEDGKKVMEMAGRYDRRTSPRTDFMKMLNAMSAKGGIDPNTYVYIGSFEPKMFKDLYGEPDSSVEIKRFESYWTYKCSDGTLTMYVVQGGGRVHIRGGDNFPAAKGTFQSRSHSKDELRQKAKAIMSRGAVSPKLNVICPSGLWIETFGQPEKSTQQKLSTGTDWVHSYPCNDGMLSVTIHQANAEDIISEK